MEKLTIGQGLMRIKKLKGKLAELLKRAEEAAVYPQDAPPAFSFHSSVEEANVVRREMLDVQTGIAFANATTNLEVDGKRVSLAYAIRLLAELKAEIAFTRGVASRAQSATTVAEWVYDGETRECKMAARTYVSALPEANKAAQVSKLQDRFDRLNDIVETANHRTTIEI